MKRTSYFNSQRRDTWPTVPEIASYFEPRGGAAWSRPLGNDTASLTLEGVDGTQGLEQYRGRMDISLRLLAHAKYGVFLFYEKSRGARYSSKGDMTKVKTYVRTAHDDLRTLAFFIPFEKAWLAVKDFIESNGDLPKSIDWVDMKEIKELAFPEPHHVPRPGEAILER